MDPDSGDEWLNGEPSRTLRNAGIGMLLVLLLAAVVYQHPALASSRNVTGVFSCLLAAGMAAAYWRGYRALTDAGDADAARRAIIGFAVLFGLVALVIPPFHSTDIFCYLNRGWMQAGYHLNPFVHPLSDVPDWRRDPMFRDTWAFAPSPYGFLFELLAREICRLGHGNWDATLLLFKAAGLIVVGLTGVVVWKGCRVLGDPRPERSLYLLLWNPVVILHSVVNGHNDLWMGMLTSAAVLLTIMGAWVGAVPVLMAAVLIKYASAALLPFTVLFLARKVGWVKAGASVGLAVALCALAAWPYLSEDWSALMRRQGEANASVQNSLAAMLLFPFEVSARRFPTIREHWSQLSRAVAIVFWLGFLLVYASLAWTRLRDARYERETYLRDCVLIQFLLVCGASSKYYAWYLGMFFPLALWLPEGERLRRVVLAVVCAHVLSVTFVAQSHFLNTAAMLVIPTILALRAGERESTRDDGT
jgi:hypothetical protein